VELGGALCVTVDRDVEVGPTPWRRRGPKYAPARNTSTPAAILITNATIHSRVRPLLRRVSTSRRIGAAFSSSTAAMLDALSISERSASSFDVRSVSVLSSSETTEEAFLIDARASSTFLSRLVRVLLKSE